ncbi:MAG: hypothetical protein Q4G13_04080 [Moraxella sp.]|nr:hypothetical protein [Moraxella sp.]
MTIHYTAFYYAAVFALFGSIVLFVWLSCAMIFVVFVQKLAIAVLKNKGFLQQNAMLIAPIDYRYFYQLFLR